MKLSITQDPLMNERSARVLAGLVLSSLILAWLAEARWVLPVLTMGFFSRAVFGPRCSPLARLAAAVAARLWAVRPAAAAPKRFAQAIGAGCLTAASLAAYGGHAALGWGLAGVVALFAALEASLGFCVGCWIYGRLAARGLVAPDVCVDCARPAPGEGAGGADSIGAGGTPRASAVRAP